MPSSVPTTVHLRHITDDAFEDAASIELIAEDDNLGNNTNDAILAYFARMSNHYLRLAKATISPNSSSRHPMKYPIIADSGANYHMFKE
jgi:hypothetical protein